MKSDPGLFYPVLALSLLIQFIGLTAGCLITDMGRILNIWLVTCLVHWICFALFMVLCRKRPFKEIATAYLSMGGLLFLCLFFLLVFITGG